MASSNYEMIVGGTAANARYTAAMTLSSLDSVVGGPFFVGVLGVEPKPRKSGAGCSGVIGVRFSFPVMATVPVSACMVRQSSC